MKTGMRKSSLKKSLRVRNVKKQLAYIAAAAFAAVMLLGSARCDSLPGSGSDKTSPTTPRESDINMPGAPSTAREPIQSDLEFFEKVIAGFDGVMYEPTLVSKQTIGGGFNYFFQAIATSIDTDIEPYTVIIEIFVGFDGVELELKRITEVEYDEGGKLVRSEVKYP